MIHLLGLSLLTVAAASPAVLPAPDKSNDASTTIVVDKPGAAADVARARWRARRGLIAGALEGDSVLALDLYDVDDVEAVAEAGLRNQLWRAGVDASGNTTLSLTASIDPTATRRAVCGALRKSHDRSITLIVTHRLGEQAAFSADPGVARDAVSRRFAETCFSVVTPNVETAVLGTGVLPRETVDAIIAAATTDNVVFVTVDVLPVAAADVSSPPEGRSLLSK